MKKEKRFLLIAVGITVVAAVAFAIVMIMMIKENGACVDAPFEYSAERLEESGGIYDCYCDSRTPELLSFKFSKDGIQIEDPEVPFSYQDINFSDIIVEKAG